MNTMTTRSVGEIVAEVPATAGVFERFGIDYCCAGGSSLDQACARAGAPVEEVLRSLERAVDSPPASPNAQDWRRQSLGALMAHILDTHHTFVRNEIARLNELIARVVGVHGANHPELLRIQDLYRGLSHELTMHMIKEEQMLFPYIEQIEQQLARRQPLSFAPFGTVQNPIRMMMFEHENAGRVLREIRTASVGFTVPPDACPSYQTLYSALEEFEQDLHRHIHLENNILFPRAIALEAEAAVTA